MFVKQAGVTVARPTSTSGDSAKPSKPIVIDAADESSIDGKAIDLRSVRPRIEQLRAADPESGVVLVADEGASTGILAAVVDQIHLGGVSDITFTTTKLAAAPGER